jgi:beta-glucosidase-like glycosyl hydrolase
MMVVGLFLCFAGWSQKQPVDCIEELAKNDAWVDSVYQQMTPEQRIAQLFWIAVEEIRHPSRFQASLKQVAEYQPGGVVFMKNNAWLVASFINQAQPLSKIPLLVAIDGENGLGMRMDSVLKFPSAMTIGAIQNEALIYRMGEEVANQFRRMGIHVNLAPVSDVNSNPLNPIIGNRSLGENPLRVAASSVLYMKGLQDGGIMAVAKHFPGHGDTDSDSHLVLPRITHTRARIDSVELLPFKALIKNGIIGVMSAHLEVPSMEPKPRMPSSLSTNVISSVLKSELGFRGLIITDAMNMKGVKVAGKPGRVDAMALIAGNDVVECSENLPGAIDEVKMAIEKGEMTWNDIELKCKKVLATKRYLRIEKNKVETLGIIDDLNNEEGRVLNQQLYESALTVLACPDYGFIQPGASSALLSLGVGNQLVDTLNKFMAVSRYHIPEVKTAATFEGLKMKLKGHPTVIVAMGSSSAVRSSFSNPAFVVFWKYLLANHHVVVTFYASPYQLSAITDVRKIPALLIAYQDNAAAWRAVARFLNGEIGADGKLPVSVKSYFKEGDGFEIAPKSVNDDVQSSSLKE